MYFTYACKPIIIKYEFFLHETVYAKAFTMYTSNFEFNLTVDVVIFIITQCVILLTVCSNLNFILFCLIYILPYDYVCFVLAYIGYNRLLLA